MAQDSSPSGRLSRRQFLRTSAFGLGVIALAACTPVASSGGQAAQQSGSAASSSATTTIKFLTQGGGQTDFDRYNPLIDAFQGAAYRPAYRADLGAGRRD